MRTARDYEERFTPENEQLVIEVLREKKIEDLADFMIRHTVPGQDGANETFEATFREALVICPPIRDLSADFLRGRIIPYAHQQYLNAHQQEA